MLNSAMGVVARDAGDGVFVDLDTIPEDSVSVGAGPRYLLRRAPKRFRNLLEKEAVGAADILLRQAARKSGGRVFAQLPQPPKLPFDLPFGSRRSRNPRTCPGRSGPVRGGAAPVPVFAAPSRVLEAAAPKLTREEELFAISLSDLAGHPRGGRRGDSRGGRAPGTGGDGVGDARRARVGSSPGLDNPQVVTLARSLREQLAPAEAKGGAEEGAEEGAGGTPTRWRRSSRRCAISHRRKPRRFARRRRAWATPCGRD